MNFQLPEALPSEWQPFHSILTSDPLVWMAEYNTTCIEQLRKRIGPSDAAIARAEVLMDEAFLKKLEDEKAIRLKQCNIEGVFAAIWLKLKPEQRNMVEELELMTMKMDASDIEQFSELHNAERIKLAMWHTHSDEAVRSLTQASEKIKRLELFHSPSLTDASLLAIKQGKSRGIQHLNVSHCPHITDEGLLSISEACKQLTSLIMNNCFSVTDVGVRHIAKGCPLLIYLELKRCSSITDLGVQYIAEGCSNLQVKRMKINRFSQREELIFPWEKQFLPLGKTIDFHSHSYLDS